MKSSLHIERLGLCGLCKKWLPLKKRWLPEHRGLDGKKCPNSEYSYTDLKYHIGDFEGAVVMAKLIANDHGRCLESGERHSVDCGDGDRCAKIRLWRAKSLAEYILANKD